MNLEKLLDRYGDMLYRLCFVMLKNNSDAEDAVQETLIQYFKHAPAFADTEHQKAWLLKVAANKCRDILRFRSRHTYVELDSVSVPTPEEPDRSILDALMTLPEKYRLVMVLHYVEGYRVEQIARIIRRTPSAVKMRLQKGRTLLGEIYRKEYL